VSFKEQQTVASGGAWQLGAGAIHDLILPFSPSYHFTAGANVREIMTPDMLKSID